MAIVVYAHPLGVWTPRPKRPPRKQKPSTLARAARAATKLPTIGKPTSEKLLKRLQAERAQHPRSLGRSPSAEPSPEVDAFFACNVRPDGPLPPPRKP